MERVTDLTYLSFTRWQKLGYRTKLFFTSIPNFFVNIGLKIWGFMKWIYFSFINFFKTIFTTFRDGDWKTRVSYFIMGFGSMARKQWLRGIMFFLFEVVFILYMVFVGGGYLAKLGSLGTVQPGEYWDPVLEIYVAVEGDNSFKILLYGVISLFFMVGLVYTWYLNIKQNKISQDILREEKKLATDKDDLRALVDEQFHKTLLALPTLGILVFTILPIVFMILIAFTNYDAIHDGVAVGLFTWVGLENFGLLLNFTNGNGASFSVTFGEILLWTLIWAFFATFTNYFLGMIVAMLINKKGIKLKKLWRTVLVISIAIPQFISLLFVSKMFEDKGIINGLLSRWFGVTLPFWTDPMWARVTVILINIWIGVPYLMLITTGILMNIPADLYESAKIDGANAFQQYRKITLPYMLFVTGPYLLTSFTSNMNNFNVIYLLTGGGPNSNSLYGSAGSTDLLVTWLYSLTMEDKKYNLASVIGIMVFAVVAVISLIVYNLIPSTRNEEDFQ